MSQEIDQKDVDLNNEQDLELDLEAEESEEKPKESDAKAEKPKETPKETPEQRVARLERQLAREKKKLGVEEKPEAKSKEKATKSGEIDFGQLAFYNTKSDVVKIESDEDIEFLQETIADTGKSQQAVLSSKWFQAELKERREAKTSADAVPKGSKRSSSASKDSVDYWLAKDELPPATPENAELRRQVVNARIKKETDHSKFSASTTGRVVRQSQIKK